MITISGQEVQGEVIDRHIDEEGGPAYYLSYRFATSDPVPEEVTDEHEVNQAMYDAYAVGQPITIRYAKSKPPISDINGNSPMAIPGKSMVSLTGGLTLGLLFLLLALEIRAMRS